MYIVTRFILRKETRGTPIHTLPHKSPPFHTLAIQSCKISTATINNQNSIIIIVVFSHTCWVITVCWYLARGDDGLCIGSMGIAYQRSGRGCALEGESFFTLPSTQNQYPTHRLVTGREGMRDVFGRVVCRRGLTSPSCDVDLTSVDT